MRSLLLRASVVPRARARAVREPLAVGVFEVSSDSCCGVSFGLRPNFTPRPFAHARKLIDAGERLEHVAALPNVVRTTPLPGARRLKSPQPANEILLIGPMPCRRHTKRLSVQHYPQKVIMKDLDENEHHGNDEELAERKGRDYALICQNNVSREGEFCW